MEKQPTDDSQPVDKKANKKLKESAPVATLSTSQSDLTDIKTTVKIIFEGEAAQKILRCEAELKERHTKPDMGKILGNEILAWNEKRWVELIEENTDIDYFFAQIRKCSDKSKSIKLLKALSEKLKNESSEVTTLVGSGTSAGLSTASEEAKTEEVGAVS